MSSYLELLAATKQQSWKNNIIEVKNMAASKDAWLIDKIKKHKEKTGVAEEVDEILDAIQVSDTLASFFCRDPKKQNICEKMQFQYLRGIGVDIQKHEISLKSGAGPVKKTDGLIAKKYYVMLKHIDDSGGAQDNQFNDLINFANCMHEKPSIYFMVVSGKYFTEKKLKILRAFTGCVVIDLNQSNEDCIKHASEYIPGDKPRKMIVELG